MGLAGRGRGRAHGTCVGPRGRGRGREGQGRAGEAEGVRGPEGRYRVGRRALRRAQGVREGPDHAVQVPPLDRVHQGAAEERGRQDPALQAAGARLVDARATVAAWRKEATDDPDGFWGRAAEELRWSRKWERVLDWQPPTFRSYRGGRSNL